MCWILLHVNSVNKIQLVLILLYFIHLSLNCKILAKFDHFGLNVNVEQSYIQDQRNETGKGETQRRDKDSNKGDAGRGNQTSSF